MSDIKTEVSALLTPQEAAPLGAFIARTETANSLFMLQEKAPEQVRSQVYMIMKGTECSSEVAARCLTGRRRTKRCGSFQGRDYPSTARATLLALPPLPSQADSDASRFQQPSPRCLRTCRQVSSASPPRRSRGQANNRPCCHPQTQGFLCQLPIRPQDTHIGETFVLVSRLTRRLNETSYRRVYPYREAARKGVSHHARITCTQWGHSSPRMEAETV